jgi:2-dehydropantoate 2-reductase
MMKIMVVGVGGVGGYVASILCASYEKDVTLVARKERGAAFRKNGLVLHSDYFGEHVFHPNIVETPGEAPVQDVVFVCVKNYSLENALSSLKPCIGPKTILVLIMNGVEHDEVVEKILPKIRLVSSAIYITSAYNKDYSIRQMGKFARIFLGSADKEAEQTVYELLHKDGLKCHISEDVRVEEWKKYILNCAYNVITAYYEGTIGKALDQPHGKEEFRTLLQESYNVGKALGVAIPENLVEETNERIINQENKNVSSSLARDVIAGRKSELETFSGYLVETAHKLNIAVPLSEKMYRELKIKCANKG